MRRRSIGVAALVGIHGRRDVAGCGTRWPMGWDGFLKQVTAATAGKDKKKRDCQRRPR